MESIQNPPAGRALEFDEIIASPSEWIALVAKENRLGETTTAEDADTALAEDQVPDPNPSALDQSNFQGSSNRIVKLLILAVVLIGITIMLFLLPSPPTGDGSGFFPTAPKSKPHDQASAEAPPQFFDEATRKPGKDVGSWDDNFIQQVTVRVVTALRGDSAAAPE